jgi:hypothetical protein
LTAAVGIGGSGFKAKEELPLESTDAAEFDVIMISSLMGCRVDIWKDSVELEMVVPP